MDNDKFLDAYLNTLATSEGAEGGDTVTGMATREYGVKDLLGVKEEDYEGDPKGLAKAVAQKNIDELKRMGVDWDNLPLPMKFNSLDIQFNMGSLNHKAPKYFKALTSGNYETAIKQSLDAIGAYDPKRKGERPTKGIALRRAMFYNMAAKDLNIPTITSINAINQNNKQQSAKVTYTLSDGPAIPISYVSQSLHSTTKPGTITVAGMTIEPVATLEDNVKPATQLKPTTKPAPDAQDSDVVEAGTTDMLETVEQEEFQRNVEAADRDEQKQQMESLLVDRPSIQTMDIAPETTDAIPVIDLPADKPEQPSLFEKFVDMFSSEEDDADTIKNREANKQDLLKGLENLETETIIPPVRMNKGGIADGEIDYSVVDDEYELPTPSDKAQEQMRSMGLDAPSILSPRTETRTAEEIAADRKSLAEMTPVIGDAMLAKEVADYIEEGSYGSAAIGTAALGVGILPGAGDALAKPIRVFAKKFRKADEQDATKFLDDPDSLQEWRDDPVNKVDKTEEKRRETRKFSEQAQKLESGEMSGPEFRRYIRENQPATKFTLQDLQTMVPTLKNTVGALGKSKASKGIVGLNKKIKKGTILDTRLDIPAYNKFNTWVASITLPDKGGNVYARTAVLKNVDFSISTSTEKVRKIAKDETKKFPMATMKGEWQDLSDEAAFDLAQKYLADPKSGYVQVGFNPERHSFFYDKDTMMPIFEAEEVIQIGALVLAKPKLPKTATERATRISKLRELKIENPDRVGRPATFNEGGTVMEKQMSMFEDGGLMDEGGTIDPVSGNDVPPGSTQEEVRDDIPAQLSEGEFVFPADVVRFIGLEKLMNLRQEAKAGLARMDAMGQMGNSEEATMPDNLPFDINDLDMEDELEYNVGGFVPNQFGIMEQPSQFAQYTPPSYQAPIIPVGQPMLQQRQPLQTGFTPPTTPVTTAGSTPTFEDLLPTTTGRYDELKEYINNDTGQKMTIPFVDGKPVYPIPQGFVPIPTDVVEAIEPEETTVPTAKTPTGDGENNDLNPSFATSDDTGIRYNAAELTNPLRTAISEYSMGPLTDGIPGMFSIFGESKVKSGAAQAAAVGGVLDAFRGGTATFSSPEKMGQLSGVYEDKDPLHTMSPQKQNVIAASINRVMESPEIKDVFVDEKGNKRTEAYASKAVEALANTYGVSLTSAGQKKSFNTLMREVTKAKELANQKAIAEKNEKAFAQAQAAAQESFQAAVDRGESYGGPGTETMETAIEKGRDPTGTAGAFTGEPTGMDDEYY